MIGAVFMGLVVVLAGPLFAIGITTCILEAVLFWRWIEAEGWTGKDPKYNKK